MNEFLKMDIFFIITTIAVVMLVILGVVVFLKVSRILGHIEHVSEQVSLESDSIRNDLVEVRRDIREGKGRLKSLFNFFGKVVKKAVKNS